MREANAWAALSQLQGDVSAIARSLPAARASEDPLSYEEHVEASAQHETAYVASLSTLAAIADSVQAEAVKLRSLRKARHHVESAGLCELMREHTHSALALGEGMARQSAHDLTAVTTHLRTEQQTARTQVAQARALLQAVQDMSTWRLPTGAQVVMGLRHADGRVETRPVETILAAAAAPHGLSDASIAAALCAKGAEATPAQTFPKRRATTSLTHNAPKAAEEAVSAEEPEAAAAATAISQDVHDHQRGSKDGSAETSPRSRAELGSAN